MTDSSCTRNRRSPNRHRSPCSHHSLCHNLYNRHRHSLYSLRSLRL